MFGWEFPPFKSGGLGTACYDLTKGLAQNGVNVTFVMPSAPENAEAEFVKLLGTNTFSKTIKIKAFNSPLTPYMTSGQYNDQYHTFNPCKSSKEGVIYGDNLYEEVFRFSIFATEVAKDESDAAVIHAHDWMTYQAGINAQHVLKKPLVVHIHATEYDRTGGSPNPYIREIEEKGLREANLVIANSNFTKKNVIKHYNLDPEKIKVVHWGIDPCNPAYFMNYQSQINKKDKIILFLGRITIQKGPDYFVEAARKVIDHYPDVKFVVAGSGDMLPRMIHRSAELGMAEKMLFAGFLKGNDVHKAFQMADLYVMPSVSEPFGLVALESIKNGTPVLISKTSGVSEVLDHALKVDFWDVDKMANQMISVLRYSDLHQELKENCAKEANIFNLDEPARKTIDIYKHALSIHQPAS